MDIEETLKAVLIASQDQMLSALSEHLQDMKDLERKQDILWNTRDVLLAKACLCVCISIVQAREIPR